MNQRFLIILDTDTDLVKHVQCFEYEFKDYSCAFPDKNGDYIHFTTEKEANEWIYENIKSEFIAKPNNVILNKSLRNLMMIDPSK